MRRLLLSAFLVLGVAACEKTPVTPPPVDGQLEPVVNPHEGDSAAQLPDPELQDGRVGRAPRRLTVNQLGRSIEVAVGRPWAGLENLATTLGRADYALVNIESTEPNLVFAKFLEDGAREVCVAQAAADVNASATDPKLRVLSRTLPTGAVGDLRKLTDAQVRELLVYLSTRFWGVPLEGEELTRWAGFFTQAAARAETIKKRDQALAAVCIGLMTDSRFLTY
ncbi:hypothetical protein [Vitiosangium sp. GDMCC 1.1324]|uniref:hypothetical protein n=1 Tax=Vitiosangium sp. (strain GDMCC 1.1324) TaxID=2138576 RepID=UPI000D3AB34E|nr:hypothetical protein [Vitiosangium sp. GDMCC 1.1324]PTL81816.1 hypothetical protein DAT35_23050 [Vitiosangium sp. GDMCC 1.1324]